MTIDEGLVSINLSVQMRDRLRQYQQQQGFQSASETVEAILQQVLPLPHQTDMPIERVATLEGRVDRLVKQVEQLAMTVAQVTVAQAIGAQDSLAHKRTSAPIAEPDAYENFEDEPDEILYGFLEPEARY